jgi:hypothetical protein
MRPYISCPSSTVRDCTSMSALAPPSSQNSTVVPSMKSVSSPWISKSTMSPWKPVGGSKNAVMT